MTARSRSHRASSDGERPPAATKSFRHGTHRSSRPEQTLERLQPFLPLMGITRVANVTGLDCIGVPVAMAIRPNARSIAVSPGKGLDWIAAKVSALMEALELWHAERIHSPLILASYNELRFNRRVADIFTLPKRKGGSLDENTRMLWIEGTDLLAKETVWVPFEVVHTNFTLPLPTGSGTLVASSNGLASGNHHLEAVSHAICEVVERDASTLWRALNETERDARLVALDSIDDECCQSILRRFQAAAVAVAVWDMTTDVGIPAFRTIIVDDDPSPLRPHLPGVGAGCHPCREIALLRALTEAAQTRLTLIAGARDDMGLAFYVAASDYGEHERALREMRRMPATRRFHMTESKDTNSFEEDVDWELARLRLAGVRAVLAVDLTKPGVGIPVVRMVVPGLEGVSDAPGYLGGARYAKKLAETTK